MILMEKKLRDEDASVVDMLLDRGSSSGHVPMPHVFTHHAPEQFEQRLQQVEKLLEVLNDMPSMEPPTNIVTQTLSRIEEVEGQARTVPGAANDVTHRPSA
jgi:hypothetical protein